MPMATIQAAIFWIMVALTPSMILVAVLLMRTGIRDDPESDLNSSQKLKFDDQRLTPTPDSGERKARYRNCRMSHFIPTPSSQTQPEVETTTATATAILNDNWDTPQTLKARGSAKISTS
jgi:hypothetical protein